MTGELIPASAVKQADTSKTGLEDDLVGDDEWNTLTSSAE